MLLLCACVHKDAGSPVAPRAALSGPAPVAIHDRWAAGEPGAGPQAPQRAALGDPDDVADTLLQARRRAQSGDWQGALDLAAQAVQSRPQDAEARLLHADLLAARGAPSAAAAVAAYREALALGADRAQAHGGALNVLLRQKDRAAASAQLEAFRREQPGHPQTVFFEVLLQLQQGDLAGAEARVETLLAHAPAEPQYQRLAGVVALQAGDADKAAGRLAVALQASPGDATMRRLLALAQVRSGRAGDAKATLQPLLGRALRDADALTLAALADGQLGDMALAHQRLAAAARLQPRAAHLRAALVLGQPGTSDREQALKDLQQLAGTGPGMLADGAVPQAMADVLAQEVVRAMVQGLIERQDFESALRVIDRLERREPKAPTAALWRGGLRLRQGDLAAARLSYERALALAPAHFAATAALARLDLLQHRPEQARDRFEALVARDPRHGSALAALARLAEETSAAPAEVVRLWRAAAQARPRDPRLQAALGRACAAAGELGCAVHVFDQLAAQQPRSAEPLIGLARAHGAARDPSAARRALQRALRVQPDSIAAMQELARLEIAQNRLAEARTLARRLRWMHPDQAAGPVIDAEVALRQRDWRGAEAAYTEAWAKEGERGPVAQALRALPQGAAGRQAALSLRSGARSEIPAIQDKL